MIKCPHCGTQQDDGAFCRACGKPMSQPETGSSGFFNSLGGLDDLSAPVSRPAPKPAPSEAPRREPAPAAPSYREPARPTHTEPATPPSSATVPAKKLHRISVGKELKLLLRQGLLILFGDKRNLIISLLFPLIAGGVTVAIAGQNMFVHHEGTKAACFILVCSAIWCGLFNSIQSLVKERANIKRDYVSGALRIECYMGSRAIIQIVLCAIQSVVLTLSIAAVDWVHGNPLPSSGLIFGEVLLDFYFSLFLVMLASDAMGLMISAMVKKEELASKLAPYILIAQLLFSGMLFEFKEGSVAYIASTVMFSRWGMEALGSICDLYGINTSIFNSLGGESALAEACPCPPTHAATCVNYQQPAMVEACQCPVVDHACSKGLLAQLQYGSPGSGCPNLFESDSNHLLTVWLILAGFVVGCLVLADILLYRVKKDGRS